MGDFVPSEGVLHLPGPEKAVREKTRTGCCLHSICGDLASHNFRHPCTLSDGGVPG